MEIRDWDNCLEADIRIDGICAASQYGTTAIRLFNADTGAELPPPPAAPQVIRWPRMPPSGDIRIAGEGQDYDSWEWSQAEGWVDRGPVTGVQPVIYDGSGYLHIVQPAPEQTSQGFRCLNQGGMPILGDATLVIAADPDGRLLHEYIPINTPNGQILVGQDKDSGVHLIFQGKRYVVDDGDVRFIRAVWTGDRIAMCVTHYNWHLVRTLTFHLGELSQFPTYPPTPPPVGLQPPRFTISEPKFPITAVVPFSVRCVYENEPGGGPLDWINWMIAGSPNGPWIVAAHNSGDDHDHTFTFDFNNIGTAYIKARGANAAGQHETGLERKVIALGRRTPPEPPAVVDRYRLATAHLAYLEVGPDLFLRQGPVGAAFEIVDADRKGFVGLKTSTGFVAAEPDGRLKADRATCSDWEYFVRTTRNGGWQFFSDAQEQYISALDDGRVLANQSEALSWETFAPEAAYLPTPELVVSGKFFNLSTGEAWHALECSDFNLVKLFMEDRAQCERVLAQRAELGFTLLRVWMLNHSVLGNMDPWTFPQMYDALSELLALAGRYGRALEVTAFTSTQGLMPNQADQAQHWQKVCDACFGHRNVLLEAFNEGDQYDNLPTITLDKPSGIICSRGSNGNDSVPPHHDAPWDYELYHISGDQWQRKTGHNAMEWADQSGRPCMTNESQRFIDNDSSETHAFDSAAGGALLAAGTCFHSQQGKLSQLFDGQTLVCARAFVEGAHSVPLEYRVGAYRHETDRENNQILRSYSRTLGDGRKWFVDIRY